MEFEDILEFLPQSKILDEEGRALLKSFHESYTRILEKNHSGSEIVLKTAFEYLKRVLEQMEQPTPFAHFHKGVRAPFDYYQMGLILVEPLWDKKHSKLLGEKNLVKMQKQLLKGENVVFLANHQTEADPQLMIVALIKKFEEITKRLVFVAGHRVTQDILAIPLSLGLNLLCIYSKKYVESPPELKSEKLTHNQKTLKEMKKLFEKGGVCIYVACSGGRDRPNSDGILAPAPFDPDSVELFYLLAKNSGIPTHFYPLSMKTYAILPPPKTVHYTLGEPRIFGYAPTYFSFGEELPMEELCEGSTDRKKRRVLRASRIYEQVLKNYNELTHD